MNVQQIVSDPRWAKATPEQRQKLISMASDVPKGREQIEPGIMDETRPAEQILAENAMTALSGATAPVGIAGLLKGARNLAIRGGGPVMKGLLSSTKELGEEYNAQNAAMGLKRRVPAQAGSYPKYNPPERIVPTKQLKPIAPAEPIPSNIPVRYPQDPGSFIQYANGRLGSGKPIDPQELLDWTAKIQNDLDLGLIPKYSEDTKRITTSYRDAIDLKSRAQAALNSASEPLLRGAKLPEGVEPTRRGLNTAFGTAAKKESFGRGIKKAAKYGLYAALGLGGTGALLNKFSGR